MILTPLGRTGIALGINNTLPNRLNKVIITRKASKQAISITVSVTPGMVVILLSIRYYNWHCSNYLLGYCSSSTVYFLASSSICIYRWIPSTSSSAIPCTMASARVSTLTVLSTNGTPNAHARLKIGMTGRTSNCK